MWEPPKHIDASITSHEVPRSQRLSLFAGSSVSTAVNDEKRNLAPALKLLLHLALTAFVHGTTFFILPLWRCSSSECESGGDCCVQSDALRLYYLMTCTYLLISSTQLRDGFSLVPRDHELTESGA